MVFDSSELMCEEALKRLDDYIDRELNEDELAAVRAHLDICAQCAERFAAEAGTLRAIRQRLRQIPLPPGIPEATARILHRLQESDTNGS